MSAPEKKLRISDGMAMFRCPGCNHTHAIYVDGSEPGANWSFNGDGDRPTFAPSVLVRSHRWHPPVGPENLAEWKKSPWKQTKVETVCHSFVTDGRIQYLDDCTHELAGQTVDLPDFPGLVQP